MRLFPPQWADTHPLFPSPPEPLSYRPSYPSAITAGLILGTTLHGLRRFFARTPLPAGHFTRTLALSSTFLLALDVAAESRIDAAALPYVSQILAQDDVPLPPRRWVARSTQWSLDDLNLAGCVAGTALALLAPRFRRPPVLPTSFPRAPVRGLSFARPVTGAALGVLAGHVAGALALGRTAGAAEERHKANIGAAADAWYARTGTEPPEAIYGPEEDVEYQERLEQEMEMLDLAGAPGRGPFSIVPHVVRDFHWHPRSVEQGFEELGETLEWLGQERARLAREAEFCYWLILDTEAGWPVVRPEGMEESAEMRLRRKKLELLSSMQRHLWATISLVDWMIMDARKLALQLPAEAKGESWFPAGRPARDPVYAPRDMLVQAREHAENLRDQLGELEARARVAPGGGEGEWECIACGRRHWMVALFLAAAGRRAMCTTR
ncbi:hypothetical protein EJ06DRAFT_427403 [Trichodelitschia bisporula]|uniref:Uncharacterized protein n=1 Tax=Trichodelitschia bisporula TaxID=703511 RepID=A0A6G1HWS0_9PEZI|nr:hypothetical protein EJ06DRAFT_427403 [Trichodelitschia bisporula]